MWFGPCNSPEDRYPTNTVFCNGIITKVVTVLSPATGKTWMDRNLGASHIANSSTDTNAYGDLYQWGRRADGHQCRNSATVTTLSSIDQPEHGDFILSSSTPNDWRSPQNMNLWQGVNGANNPCPSGFRLPTVAEFIDERSNWSSRNAAGAFASPLKLTMAGGRDNSNGSLQAVGAGGFYWSSTVIGNSSEYLLINANNADYFSFNRAIGSSVRCIKD
jgi:uncharacterized protein (TIGR02145 family)